MSLCLCVFGIGMLKQYDGSRPVVVDNKVLTSQVGLFMLSLFICTVWDSFHCSFGLSTHNMFRRLEALAWIHLSCIFCLSIALSIWFILAPIHAKHKKRIILSIYSIHTCGGGQQGHHVAGTDTIWPWGSEKIWFKVCAPWESEKIWFIYVPLCEST